jgi:hypothetical protein
VRPEVPEDLANLVMRALSARPRSRPASARDFQDELRSAFDGPRHGSASFLKAAPTSLPEQPSRSQPRARPAESFTPATAERLDGRPAHDAPAILPPRPVAPAAPLFEERPTNVDMHVDATLASQVSPGVDEASADHPVRTARPPASMDIDIEVDLEPEGPATSRGDLLADLELQHHAAPPGRQTGEDEETATMQLTPEVRARIAQMTKAAADRAAAARQIEDSAGAPATRRVTKP